MHQCHRGRRTPVTCRRALPRRLTQVVLGNDSDKAAEAILLRCKDDTSTEHAIAGRIQRDLKKLKITGDIF